MLELKSSLEGLLVGIRYQKREFGYVCFSQEERSIGKA